MTGRTNASRSGAELTLIWTNPSPNVANASFTVNSSFDVFGFIAECKSGTSNSDDVFIKNFIPAGSSAQWIAGVALNGTNPVANAYRQATATKRTLTMTTAPAGSGTNAVIPLRVYAIPA